MFKTYLEWKLDKKTKQLESQFKLDKQVTKLKFKGNQKKFELNAQIDSVFDRIRSANGQRQKLTRISDKSADSWKVVDEYAPDELASGSEKQETLTESQGGSKQENETAYVRPSWARQKIQWISSFFAVN